MNEDREALKKIRELLKEYDVNVDPDEDVEWWIRNMTIGEYQETFRVCEKVIAGIGAILKEYDERISADND